MPPVERRPSTVAEVLAIPDAQRFHELLDGEIVRKADPSYEHGDAQSSVVTILKERFHRPAGDGEGGWWIATEVEIELNGELVRPDVVGWRRDVHRARPSGTPVSATPDWICEVLSTTNASNDTVRKLRVYHRNQIAYYWILDPTAGSLTVHRWAAEGYVVVLAATRQERVSPAPFDSITVSVGRLLGDDPA